MSAKDDILKNNPPKGTYQQVMSDADGSGNNPPKGTKEAVEQSAENAPENTVHKARTTVPNRQETQNADSSEKKVSTYAELLEELYPKPNPEQLKKDAKRARTRNIISALGDGISALANLHYTGRGAPDMYDGRNSLSAKSQARYDKLMQDYKDNLEKYRQARLKAAQLDDERNDIERQWQRILDRDAVADDHWKQDFDYRKERDDANDAYRKERADADDAYRKEQQKNAGKTYNSNRTVGIGSGEGKEKEPICFNNGDRTIEVNPEKWRNNYHHLYDMLVKEGVVKEERNEKPTSDQMQSAVLRHWYNSPSVTKEIISLSDRYEGYDERFGDITIPYSQWYDEYQNIFDKMFEEAYPALDSPTIKQYYIRNKIPQGIEQYIRDNWMNSPSAIAYINRLAGMENAEEDDNTAPYLRK